MKKQSKSELILNGSMYKVLITLSVPIMINNLIQTLYNLIDGIWVSKLGSVQFAATSFVWPVTFLFISLGMGISIANTALLSQLLGAKKYKEANKYAAQTLVISVIIALIFTIIGFITTPYIIRFMGATGDLYKYSVTFLRLSFLDTVVTFIYFNFNSVMNAQGNTVTPTILSGASAILNAALDPLYIFTFHMGIGGAAIATLTSKIVLAAVAMYIMFKKSSVIKPRLRGFKFDKGIIKKVLQVAIPSSVGQSGSALGFMVLNIFIASFGTSTLGAFGMVNRISSLLMQPPMGIGTALTSIIGQNLGNNNVVRAKEGFKKAVVLTLVLSIVGAIFLIWKDTAVISFFMQSSDDQNMIAQSLSYLFFTSLMMPLMGLFSIFQGVFQGSGHTKYSMFMEVGRLWAVRLPLILILKNFTSLGPTGIWFSMSFSNLIICFYGFAVYKRGKWQHKLIKTSE
ncbi:MATE family efflux transporter [Inconstantimicrobium mannanitabidum]|uniref:MATE family efflux transporter n=1 Tax=Inconstantimicrobium mannanitabidum TaxID=1604901 RepID=A0ACB5RC00_9CLOT|nr:MATE family efflux transporter [Clostridium sp. TW13]GKX66226.1 MATE family efflux transporter [Clostridium sp. TW13]